MQAAAPPRLLALLLLGLLLAPLLQTAPEASGQGAFRSLPGLEGPRSTLRLYGCIDALAAAPAPRLATAFRDGPITPVMPDGRPDCDGDRLHLGAAFHASATEPFTRRALGPRDQTTSLSVRYLPTAWFPADVVADPIDPARGLFDVDADGALDYAPPVGATPGAPPADLAHPRDAFPDFAATGDGQNGDRYMPALETRYDHTWTAGSDRTVPLPSGGGLLLPVATRDDAPGLDSYQGTAERLAAEWHGRPFGFGDGADAFGALHTPEVTLRQGDEIWFLDHGLRVSGFFGTPEAPRVEVEVMYAGRDVIERLSTAVILTPAPDDDSRHATLEYAPDGPGNLVFADRTGIDRDLPTIDDPRDPAADAAWFALVTRASVDADGADHRATLRVGRLVSTIAPWSAFVVDRVLYRFDALDEHDAALHRLALTAVHPLGADIDIPSAALKLRGTANDRGIPLLPPFDRPHQRLRDLEPALLRDAYGFFTESGDGDGRITSAELGLRADAATPDERAAPAERLAMQWRSRGHEERLIVPVVGIDSDDALLMSALLPNHYVELVLPDGRYRVDTMLLDDRDTILGASAAPDSPRAFRSFVFDPREARPYFYGADGLRLFGATRAARDAGDVLLFDPALLRWSDVEGRIQTPDRLADQAVRLSLRYDPFHPFTGAAALQPALASDGSLRDASRGVHDNLWDAAQRRQDIETGVYAPALTARYSFHFLDRSTLAGLSPDLGPRTALLLPAADADPQRVGLDSFDMDGNGRPDAVFLRGYWDMSGSGRAEQRLVTSGRFLADGNASTADLMWLRTGPFTIAPGVEVQFFDHALRFTGTTADGGEVTPRFEVLDRRAAGTPRIIATSDAASPDAAGCIVVRWDATVAEEAEPCGDIHVSPVTPNRSPGPDDAMWWVEVQAVRDGAVTIVLNRMVTDVDRAAPGDQSVVLVGGQVYAWERPVITEDRLEALVLSHILPAGFDIALPAPGGQVVPIIGVRTGGVVPLLPPYERPHDVLQLQDVALELNEQRFLDRSADASDTDAVLARRIDRVDRLDPLLVRLVGLDVEARHHLAYLDPTRGLDPTRSPGTAFVNGMFAVPWAGHTEWAGPREHLAVDGPDGFDEALRSADDRGWDQSARLLIENVDRVVVDSARLAAPERTALVMDQGQVPSTVASSHPNEPAWLIAGTTRGTGLWVVRLHETEDLYVGHLPGSGRPDGTPTPSPTGVTDGPPLPTTPWPSQTDPGVEPRDGPLPVVLVLVAVLIVAAAVARRRT